MPLQFASKEDYLDKLTELMFVEAECERLNTEMIAEKNIKFEFKERLEIYCTLWLEVPKTIQQQIRENVILSVVMSRLDDRSDYVGTGVIKKVQMTRNCDFLRVLLQIDCQYPLNKRQY